MYASVRASRESGNDQWRAYGREGYWRHREALIKYSAEYRASESGKSAMAAWKARNAEHIATQKRQYKVAMGDVITKQNKEYRQANRRRIALGVLVKKYGVTLARAEELYNQRVCDICGATDRAMHTDHDHANGRIRGRLCGPCNQALGLLRDSPSLLMKAIQYLAGGATCE